MREYSLLAEPLIRKHQLIDQLLDEAKKQLDSFSPEKLAFMKRQSLISNIGASTRIENAILTDVEIEWIDTVVQTDGHHAFLPNKAFIQNKLSKDKSRSIEEVAGYRDAFQIMTECYPDFYPLKESDLQGIHRELLKYYPKALPYLGHYKQQTNSVVQTNLETGQTHLILKTSDPGPITQAAMATLIHWYNATLPHAPWPVAIAAECVFRFLAIHPFQDGNGRLSRILFQLILMSAHTRHSYAHVVPFLGLDRCLEQTRPQYYAVLRRCSQGIFHPDPNTYTMTYFIDYMLDCLHKSISHITIYAQKYDRTHTLSESSTRLLALFKESPEQSMKTATLIAASGLPRRTVGYALQQLLAAKFIQSYGQGPSTRYTLIF